MTDDTEKRRTFRLTEPVLLKYDVLDEVDFELGLQRWQIRSGGFSSLRSMALDIDARLDELLFQLGNESSVCRDAIKLLNQKLDIALDASPEFRQSRESLANVQPQECEVSADSLAFGCKTALAENTRLWLRFMLISDNRFFETFGSVLRSDDLGESDDQKFRYRVIACFHGMQAAERETLIQHLFSRQSETLRMRRIEADDAI